MTGAATAGLLLAALGLLAGCDRGAGTASATAAGSGTTREVAAGATPAVVATTVRTVTPPADACGWISAADISKIVGPLTGAPYPTDDGCVFPLPMDTATAHRNAQVLELRRKLRESGDSDLEPLAPDTSAVIVDVQVYTNPTMARGMGAAFAQMGKWLCDDSASDTMPWCRAAARGTAPPTPAPGWDRSNAPASRSFFGLVGHVAVNVEVRSAEVSHAQAVAIADRVRDAIPDLPFPATRPSTPAGPDPCILLSAKEVEAVLGRLVVAPYRSDEETPLAMPQGRSCSYYTAGHHALVVTPTWEYGGMAFDAMKGVGGIIETVAPSLHDNASDTLDSGPWEDAAGDPATGQLVFLKGDRALALSFLYASTDFDGVVRLARLAVGRL